MSIESFISLYSNVGIKADLEESIIKGAESKKFLEADSNIQDIWKLESVMFLLKFENGVILSDRYDFNSENVNHDDETDTYTVSAISLTNNSFTTNEFTTILGNNALLIDYSGNYSTDSVNFTIYVNEKKEQNIYYSCTLTSTSSNWVYNYKKFNYNKDTENAGDLISVRVFCKWNKDTANFFSLAFKPNFLRVQTNHSSIINIAYKYTKNNNEYTGTISINVYGMRQYSYIYTISEWKEKDGTGEETDKWSSDNNYLRIYSNRDKISFLIGKPNDEKDDEDIYTDSDGNLTENFTMRYTKEDDEWKWLNNLGDGCTLTGIWVKFNDISIITSNTTVNELIGDQFMYGNGTVIYNKEGYVYSDCTVKTNGGENAAFIYGNGNVETNKNFVYGNGNVETNKNFVYGNGNVTNNDGWVLGNGNVTTNYNDSYVYGNSNVTNNDYGNVYGNGDVTNNYSKVYGNGTVDNNDGTISRGTEYDEDDEIIDPEDNVYGNGKTITVNDEIIERVINGLIFSESSVTTIPGNTVNILKETEYSYPNTIVNSSVIYDSNVTAVGNRIDGNTNVINGFRVYNNNVIIGGTRNDNELTGYNGNVANLIIGDYNVINPNYVEKDLTGVEISPNIVIGNYNIINDPNTIVLKGTCNVFNDLKN